MKNILILLLISISSFGQDRPDIKLLALHGDTLWVKNVTTGDSTQINKVAASVTSQSIINALGYTPASVAYAINLQALTSSPADNVTTYFGDLPKALTTAAGQNRILFRRSGTIKLAEIYCYSGTAGTAESWSLYIRKNNTTDYLVATVASATNERIFSNTSLSIPIVSGDWIEIKSVQPTWVTNPLTSIFSGYVTIE